MIYLDTSVALAHLLAEDRGPPDSFWDEVLVSSRLLEYEVWVNLNRRGPTAELENAARLLIGRIGLLELNPIVLGRALEPFPGSVRTLDALHLTSLIYLADHGQEISLASYDARMLAAARALNVTTIRPESFGG